MRHLLEYLMARALFGVLGRLPTGPGERLGAALGRVAHRLGWRRAVVEDQLARAFPDRGRDWVRSTGRACYEHLGREAVAVTWLARAGGTAIRRAVERFEGRERLAEALAESGSAVIVTGHLGNWEVAGSTLPAFGFPMDAVMQGIKNPWLDTYVRRVRRRLGMGLVDRVDAWDRLVETLRDGRIVAFVADQDARERGVFVPFFGRLASTHRAPALLALRADVP
ncbi:MAG: hypothetical protein GWN71_22210, partial [Gammaproteobacteria bacterium]|nr:hypothetical protein [Gammaproteobacteria bacterium]NIX24891.1 hypothetical protein [Actinomycetota bacterium]